MPTQYDHPSDTDLARLDALLVDREDDWWNSFYEDRARPIPFFVRSPDESLVEWVDAEHVHAGRALDLGCGNGRNAVFLAGRGFSVEAVDHSRTAIDWAKQRAAEASVNVRLVRQSVFDLQPTPGGCDLIYDSGCFHHLPPHRRSSYVGLVTDALAQGGWFGLACFRPEGGSGCSDDEVYERGSLGGGLGYTEERLREIWSGGLEVRAVRQMKAQRPESGLFGASFLWSLWAIKP